MLLEREKIRMTGNTSDPKQVSIIYARPSIIG